jgi:regulator of protease activity HflC (stomatin/prohibitin superfamily)
MTGFFEWLASIWEHLKCFRIVSSYEQGIRFRRGVPEPAPLGSGLWFHWPTLDRIEVLPVREDWIDLLVQSITTADGVEVALSANIGYTISDAVKAYTSVHDYHGSLGRLASAHLHRRIHDLTYADLMGSLPKLEKSLEGTLTTRSKPWGIVIQDVGVTDLVRARAYRLLQG